MILQIFSKYSREICHDFTNILSHDILQIFSKYAREICQVLS